MFKIQSLIFENQTKGFELQTLIFEFLNFDNISTRTFEI